MGVKGKKAKGNAAEEYVAKKLRDIYNLNEDEIYRSPNSGNASRELGDIFVIKRIRDDKFPFVLECKNHEGWDIRSIFPDLSKIVTSWYEQVRKECENTNYSPVLIITKAYYPYYVIISGKNLDESKVLSKRTYLKCKNNFYVLELDEFLSYVKECYG